MRNILLALALCLLAPAAMAQVSGQSDNANTGQTYSPPSTRLEFNVAIPAADLAHAGDEVLGGLLKAQRAAGEIGGKYNKCNFRISAITINRGGGLPAGPALNGGGATAPAVANTETAHIALMGDPGCMPLAK